jgi:Ecdysteroid kinase-like family
MTQSVEIACDVADITPQWLTGVLARRGIEAEVDSITAAPIGTGQIGSCFRLTIEYAAGDGPASLVAKLPSQDPARRTADAFTYRCEVGFYREVAPRVNVRRPDCYLAARSESGEEFTLLLEDLAPATQGDQISGCTAEQARAAVVNLAGLHAPLWCDTSLLDLDWLVPNGAEFAEISAALYRDATSNFVERYSLSDETIAVLTEFADKSQAWWQRPAQPFSLIHADYRLDNLMFAQAEGEVSVTAVDWQACSLGSPLRDVAYMVVTGLTETDRRTAERDLVAAYWHALQQQGVTGYEADQCWQDYRHSVFHAPVVTVFGASAAKRSERGDRMFTVMAERAATAIADLDALSLLSE